MLLLLQLLLLFFLFFVSLLISELSTILCFEFSHIFFSAVVWVELPNRLLYVLAEEAV